MMFALFALLILFLALVVFLFLNFNPAFGAKANKTTNPKILNSPNFVDGKFVNLSKKAFYEPKRPPLSAIWKYFSTRVIEPNTKIPVEQINPLTFEKRQKAKTRVFWFGHSSVLVEIDGKRIFFDPMFSDIPSPLPFGSRRFSGKLPMSTNDLPQLDAVLISHDHYDHLDYKTILAIKHKTKKFFVPLGVGQHLKRWSVAKSKIVEFDWWEKLSFEGLEIVLAPTQHFSARSFFNRYSTLWGSWIVLGGKHRLYFSGDSGYSDTFAEIGKRFGPFDLALLECGQYSHLWPDSHMSPNQTLQAFFDLEAKLMIPIHWGAFKLSFHWWNEPAKKLTVGSEKLGVNLRIPKIGEQVVLGVSKKNESWWED